MNPYKQKIIKNLDNIKELLQSFNKDYYTLQDLTELYQKCIELKYVYKNTPTNTFNKVLNENNLLTKKFQLKFFNKNFTRFFKAPPDVYELALSIDPQAYLSHYTAVFLHNLTNNIPKDVFVNKEHLKPLKTIQKMPLEQKNLDKAFYSPARITQNLTTYKTNTINIINGKYTNNTGVIKKRFNDQTLKVTNIERTLIDITVSPQYCGGTYEVLNTYKKAKGIVKPNKLLIMLNELDFIYPYHQAIGFFMEKAGYKESDLNIFEAPGIQYRFFVQRELRYNDRKFSERWNLYYPEFL
ncbi:MAG: hypothetical protein AB1782_05985 [Cyanobacteriota bacterium]